MKNTLFIALVILLSFFAIKPLFHLGFFPVHDAAQPQRIFEMYTSLHEGMFPVRWVKDFGYGYGYPLFNFYAPFAYYLGAFFLFLGSSLLFSTKIVIGTAIVLSGIFMFF